MLQNKYVNISFNKYYFNSSTAYNHKYYYCHYFHYYQYYHFCHQYHYCHRYHCDAIRMVKSLPEISVNKINKHCFSLYSPLYFRHLQHWQVQRMLSHQKTSRSSSFNIKYERVQKTKLILIIFRIWRNSLIQCFI